MDEVRRPDRVDGVRASRGHGRLQPGELRGPDGADHVLADREELADLYKSWSEPLERRRRVAREAGVVSPERAGGPELARARLERQRLGRDGRRPFYQGRRPRVEVAFECGSIKLAWPVRSAQRAARPEETEYVKYIDKRAASRSLELDFGPMYSFPPGTITIA